jgi:large subunit ribosomal protein L21
MYAVIRSGSKQYRVAPGETVRVETLPGKIGGKVTFDDVLAVRTDEPKLVTGDALGKAIVRKNRGAGPREKSDRAEIPQDQAI